MIGHVTITMYDSEGNVISYIQNDNLVVDEGIDTVGDLIFPDINLNGNATDSQFSFIGIGEGVTAPAAGNTGLETPIIGCSFVQDGAVTGTSAVSGEITVTVDGTFLGTTCAGAITEAVLANDATGGEVLARQTFAVNNLGAADSITMTWEITIT